MSYKRFFKRMVPRMLALALILAQLLGSAVVIAAPGPDRHTDDVVLTDDDRPDEGGSVTILLNEGTARSEPVAESSPATTEPLTEAATAALLDRLPALPVETTDVQDFRLPPETLPAPRTGQVITQPFPPADSEAGTIPLPPAGPLEVVRFSPEGEISVAPFLSVTFNQPMVPLGTLEQLNAETVPVVITPTLEGQWRWIGTQTLTFEYAGNVDRFPKATEYTVEVPAGTTSAAGNELAESVMWSFTTPPPVVTGTYPSYGPQPRDPLFFIAFDQRIDPAAVLDFIAVTANREEFALRPASDEEIAADKAVKQLTERAGEDRWIAFRSEALLPADTTINVAVMTGAPSAEGPLTTEHVQSYTFQTYAPLRITETYCQYGGGDCPPLSPFTIQFNNPIDQAGFDPSLITVEPTIADITVEALYDAVRIRGLTAGRTEYTVTVSRELQDTFGQRLGEDEVVTFRTGDAPQSLIGPNKTLVTLDPSAVTPTLSVYSINYGKLRVRAYRVTPEDWPAYQQYLREYRYQQKDRPAPPGTRVMQKTLTLDAPKDQMVETAIDLSDALSDAPGHLIVTVDTPTVPIVGDLLRRANPFVIAWVQSTQIGLDAFADNSRLVAWTTALADGAPMAGVTVSLLNQSEPAITDEDGVAALSLPQGNAPILMAKNEGDSAILPVNPYYWDDEGWRAWPQQDELRWYVFDDRQMYRPGEEVHVKGWLRRIEAGPTGDVALANLAGSTVTYEIYDPRGNELDRGDLQLTEQAGFDLAFTLPENVNLGYATLYLRAPSQGQSFGAEYSHNFQIQEFRRPEFEVTAQILDQGPFFLHDTAEAQVAAKYFAGGPLPGAQTTWDVSATPAAYAPPNWPEFIFGTWTPWWWYFDEYGSGMNEGDVRQSFGGRTDAAGNHYLEMTFSESAQPRPYRISAEARVTDVNRQTWASATSLLLHPAAVYVGLRSERTFVEKGEPLELQAIVTDVDGEPVAGRTVDVTAVRLKWVFEEGNWTQQEVDPQSCTHESTDEPQTCTFATSQGGQYRITATVRDEAERLNRTVLTRWVSGGERPPARNVEQEEVQLIPDKETYQPGDTAEILVQAPFTPAQGLLTVTRSGILYTERFSMDEATATLQVPIADEHIPNLILQVDLVGAAPRVDDAGVAIPAAPDRPAYASGSLTLTIPPLNRTLDVAVEPAAARVEPGAETSIDLTVTDAAGAPVAGAEIALVAVDEAVLALTNYTLQDPVSLFYSERSSDLRTAHGRGSIILANAQALVEEMANQLQVKRLSAMGTGGGEAADEGMVASAAMDMAMPMATAEPAADGGDQAGAPIAVRTDFNPLALFAPAVITNELGQATVDLQLPDNLTRYRIMAVAVSGGNYFGAAEANLTARLPLMVRPSAPRFLNFGDEFELPVVIQNQTDEEMSVGLAVRAVNLELTGDAGVNVSVPANDRVEVRIPARTSNAGTVRLQFGVSSGDYADAAQVELPVYTPATTEAFAAYGVIDDGATVQPLLRPANVYPQFGGLELSTSSTALQALTDAVLYLQAYPFECSEQIASRVLGIAALRDVLSAFQAEGLPDPAELEAAVNRDIGRLESLQRPDGGWPVWSNSSESLPFYTIHVAHALQRAADKGFPVSLEVQQRALTYLRNIEAYYPYWYSARTRRTLSAYALYVRQLMGDVDIAKARQLYAEAPLEEQSLDIIAWLWQVMRDDPAASAEVEAIRRHVGNRVVETPGAANFITDFDEQAYLLLESNRRTDALLLDALINDEPESDLIPKVVNGLLAHRTRGRWGNTQENVFVLLAMDNYFNTFEAQTPDFVARMWLGDTYVAEHAFEGRSTDSQLTAVPMSYLMDGAEQEDLIIAKEGDGRLYYRLGLRYAPEDLELEPLDMGFVVQRSYEAVDDPDDVQLDENGVWRIKAGARVRVRVQMVAPTRRYHVALTDPLPAGLEAINPALAVSESVPNDSGVADEPQPYRSWWWGPWYEHDNLRDQRAEAFATLLWEGVYEYSYVARATTPGNFVVPPAKAEEMYAPEVFGRSAGDRVVVE
ncbi:MAG: Ig-like domain-containing protein [Caldilineaceae bacterium]|nr:Ig-like domain-containing protein [Caldilineaceae bacterium]